MNVPQTEQAVFGLRGVVCGHPFCIVDHEKIVGAVVFVNLNPFLIWVHLYGDGFDEMYAALVSEK